MFRRLYQKIIALKLSCSVHKNRANAAMIITRRQNDVAPTSRLTSKNVSGIFLFFGAFSCFKGLYEYLLYFFHYIVYGFRHLSSHLFGERQETTGFLWGIPVSLAFYTSVLFNQVKALVKATAYPVYILIVKSQCGPYLKNISVGAAHRCQHMIVS